jgi:hypothetical protein
MRASPPGSSGTPPSEVPHWNLVHSLTNPLTLYFHQITIGGVGIGFRGYDE